MSEPSPINLTNKKVVVYQAANDQVIESDSESDGIPKVVTYQPPDSPFLRNNSP